MAQSADRILTWFAEDPFLTTWVSPILIHILLPLKEAGQRVRIVHPSAHFRKVFGIVGLSPDAEMLGAMSA